ncbi:hypothetical protein AB6D20_027600 (plasmid) [Vibrio splendidus]
MQSILNSVVNTKFGRDAVFRDAVFLAAQGTTQLAAQGTTQHWQILANESSIFRVVNFYRLNILASIYEKT